jgi:hypothetical protein
MLGMKRVASLALGVCVSTTVYANESVWLPVRDQNPFVLGSGLPLLPQPTPVTGGWEVEATLDESNTQLISRRRNADTAVVFGAETRESRVSFSYAFAADWSARASIGDEWIGVGFLDKPIQHFHSFIGAPRGYRGGRLGERPPVIRVYRNGELVYELDRPGQALAPLLLDVTHTWDASETSRYGVSLGAKLSVGDTKRLSDTGDTGVSVSAFGEFMLADELRLGARIGYLQASGNDVLRGSARSAVPFGDVSLRLPLIGRWSGFVQYDLHGALYRQLPQFLGYAGQLTLGVARPIGSHGAEFLFGLSEDVPIAHTQDVSFLVALRY